MKPKTTLIKLLSYEDRGIAIGRNGEYIKAVNQLLKRHIRFQNNKPNIKIECKITSINGKCQN
ncbi:MAG: KH domain-containing protein [Promethearchaeota archaeon]